MLSNNSKSIMLAGIRRQDSSNMSHGDVKSGSGVRLSNESLNGVMAVPTMSTRASNELMARMEATLTSVAMPTYCKYMSV